VSGIGHHGKNKKVLNIFLNVVKMILALSTMVYAFLRNPELANRRPSLGEGAFRVSKLFIPTKVGKWKSRGWARTFEEGSSMETGQN
jgi:hypothetical protein